MKKHNLPKTIYLTMHRATNMTEIGDKMEEVQETINKITENRCDNLDIGQYLDSPLVLVKANAILAVIRQKIIEKQILAKLDVISRNIRQEPRVWGLLI